MCGIAGIYGFDRRLRIESEQICRMCAAMYHRGPDEEGIFVKGHVGLGMRRLSIIDLVSGQQPIHNEDGTIQVVFNGEIYNYAELRGELLAKGHRLYTQSDTEVIPHLYEEMGANFVTKLRGMFAIALYDQRQDRLLLVRDRLGKKPLIYSAVGDRIFFASELRCILSVAPELAVIDREALLNFLWFGYILDPKTAFEKIKKLPPGHMLECHGGKIKISRYWDVPSFEEDDLPESQWLDRLEHELENAVRMRLISDVPLGAMLSGGVDSSTVVALMSRVNSAPVKTFSISFAKQDFDEGKHARRVAERFRTEHHELLMEPDFGRTLNQLTTLLEEPFGDSSLLPTFYVSKLVREHVKVALSGDGADELFAGYDRYAINLQRDSFSWIPRTLGSFYRRSIYPRLPREVPGRRFLYNISLPFRDRYLDSVSFLRSDGRDASLFSPDFIDFAKTCEDPEAAYQSHYDSAPAANRLSKLQYLDIKTYLASDILPKVDRMSMAASLESRAPFLDHVFVELAARVPAALKIRAGESKYLLKRLAERAGVPKEVLYRPKQGFAVPLVHWFRNELKGEISGILSEPKTMQRGYFDVRAIRRLLSEHASGLRDRSAEVWLLLVLELWHRNFVEALHNGNLFQQRWNGDCVRDAPIVVAKMPNVQLTVST